MTPILLEPRCSFKEISIYAVIFSKATAFIPYEPRQKQFSDIPLKNNQFRVAD